MEVNKYVLGSNLRLCVKCNCEWSITQSWVGEIKNKQTHEKKSEALPQFFRFGKKS